MAAHRHYCDYNATAPLRPEARDAILDALDIGANPSSVHGQGRRARAIIEDARDQIAASVGACRDDIVFTSGGTEANAATLWGARDADPALELWVSAIEHEAVAAQSPARILPVDEHGVLVLDALEAALGELADGSRPLVSVMLANNETGVVQPVAEIADKVHAAGGLLHCDAVQAFGKIPVSVIDLEVDYLTVSAHKIGGPQGAGAFFLKPGVPFAARQIGGGQELGRRSGTENVAGIAGFGAAAVIAIDAIDELRGLAASRDEMEARLAAAVPSSAVHGADVARLPNTSCFGLADFPAETQVMAMDLAGVSISAGAACSSGKVAASRVLTAMGRTEAEAKSAIRASFGWASTQDDFDVLATAWIAAVQRARPELVVNKEPAHVGD
ncbi:MAG: cysteine desulfurase family protein [Pseudomonadota bacterium]